SADRHLGPEPPGTGGRTRHGAPSRAVPGPAADRASPQRTAPRRAAPQPTAPQRTAPRRASPRSAACRRRTGGPGECAGHTGRAKPPMTALAQALNRITVADLRRRGGLKWTYAGPDVLGAFVAEMD